MSKQATFCSNCGLLGHLKDDCRKPDKSKPHTLPPKRNNATGKKPLIKKGDGRITSLQEATMPKINEVNKPNVNQMQPKSESQQQRKTVAGTPNVEKHISPGNMEQSSPKTDGKLTNKVIK